MTDEDFTTLHEVLRRMAPDVSIQIGNFMCNASELLWVIEEAASAREKAKAHGVYEPYEPVYRPFMRLPRTPSQTEK